MRRWTMREIRYLEEHANEGSAAIAKALGRSAGAVRIQASHYGISLRKRWHCPKCGHWSCKPLNARTGWCATCTKRDRRAKLEEGLRTCGGRRCGRRRRTVVVRRSTRRRADSKRIKKVKKQRTNKVAQQAKRRKERHEEPTTCNGRFHRPRNPRPSAGSICPQGNGSRTRRVARPPVGNRAPRHGAVRNLPARVRLAARVGLAMTSKERQGCQAPLVAPGPRPAGVTASEGAVNGEDRSAWTQRVSGRAPVDDSGQVPGTRYCSKCRI